MANQKRTMRLNIFRPTSRPEPAFAVMSCNPNRGLSAKDGKYGSSILIKVSPSNERTGNSRKREDNLSFFTSISTESSSSSSKSR